MREQRLVKFFQPRLVPYESVAKLDKIRYGPVFAEPNRRNAPTVIIERYISHDVRRQAARLIEHAGLQLSYRCPSLKRLNHRHGGGCQRTRERGPSDRPRGDPKHGARFLDA
jgi:hypothetical protein